MKAVLFDMDGVLIDVSLSYRLVIKKVVEYFLNINISFSKIQEYKNRSGLNNDWDLTESILKDYGQEVDRREIIDAFQRIYLGDNLNGLVRNEKWLLDRKILENIKRKFRVGIVTGRPREEALYALRRFEFESYFPVVITMDDLPEEKAKPDPSGIELALKKLNTLEGYYVGDSIDDMVTALNANVVPIGIVSKDKEYDKQKNILLYSGAQWVLRSINDILEVLE